MIIIGVMVMAKGQETGQSKVTPSDNSIEEPWEWEDVQTEIDTEDTPLYLATPGIEQEIGEEK
jgi:hypothetical protein